MVDDSVKVDTGENLHSIESRGNDWECDLWATREHESGRVEVQVRV